jgi:hypothetical protein
MTRVQRVSRATPHVMPKCGTHQQRGHCTQAQQGPTTPPGHPRKPRNDKLAPRVSQSAPRGHGSNSTYLQCRAGQPNRLDKQAMPPPTQRLSSARVADNSQPSAKEEGKAQRTTKRSEAAGTSTDDGPAREEPKTAQNTQTDWDNNGSNRSEIARAVSQTRRVAQGRA